MGQNIWFKKFKKKLKKQKPPFLRGGADEETGYVWLGFEESLESPSSTNTKTLSVSQTQLPFTVQKKLGTYIDWKQQENPYDATDSNCWMIQRAIDMTLMVYFYMQIVYQAPALTQEAPQWMLRLYIDMPDRYPNVLATAEPYYYSTVWIHDNTIEQVATATISGIVPLRSDSSLNKRNTLIVPFIEWQDTSSDLIYHPAYTYFQAQVVGCRN